MLGKPWNRSVSWVRVIVGSTLGIAAVTTAALYFWLAGLGVFSVSDSQLDLITSLPQADNSLVLDREGNKIGEFFTQYHRFIPYDELPPRMVQAILAVEDRNFFHHKGFDPRGILRALVVSLRDQGYSQGASTLTQQLVRHFLLTKKKSLERKVQELALAYQLEKRLSKKRIFELYANRFFLGNGAYGVGAAAERYFGRPLAELNVAEIALIAGLFQSPSAYNPSRYPARAIARQKVVLQTMVDSGFLEPALATQASLFPLKFETYQPLNTQVAPYFIDHIAQEAKALLENKKQVEGQGLRIHTTLDPKLQSLGERSLKEAPTLWAQAAGEKRKGAPVRFDAAALEAALVVVDPKSGEVLAMLGGRDYQKSQFNRVTAAARSPGSTFKPVVYSLALQNGWNWNALHYIEPVTVKDYRPRNLTGDYGTETTLLRAFYRSLNTAAVELVGDFGVNRLLAHAKLMGVSSPLKAEVGTALGGSEVTMMDLARVYGTLANEGLRMETTTITRIEDREGTILYQAPQPESRGTRALTPQTAYLMTEGLRSVLLHGTATQASDLAAVAVGKTGTSNQAKDNWFAGYTSNLVCIVWVGTDGNEALPSEAMGSTLALPIWHSFVKEALALRPAEPFSRPPGITEAQVHSQYGNRLQKGGMRMYFLSGREPASRGPSPLEVVTERGGFRRIFE
jgi:penicillin-binding protein 1A